MKRTRQFAAIGLALALAGCSAGAASPTGAISSAVAGAPYVKLRWADAQTVQLPGQGYDRFELSATGFIELQNVGYQKQVIVRYQGDQGWADVTATYYGPASGNDELWRFTTGAVTYLPYFGSGELGFAIAYTVDGVTVWDNDDGRNYAVWGQGAGLPVSTIALGQDNVKVADSSLTTASDGNVLFAGHVILKNLAYEKDVVIVETTDDWKTIRRVEAAYDYAVVGSDTLERWSFSEPLPAGVSQVRFAAAYTVAGSTYWDNNLGADYVASALSTPAKLEPHPACDGACLQCARGNRRMGRRSSGLVPFPPTPSSRRTCQARYRCSPRQRCARCQPRARRFHAGRYRFLSPHVAHRDLRPSTAAPTPATPRASEQRPRRHHSRGSRTPAQPLPRRYRIVMRASS